MTTAFEYTLKASGLESEEDYPYTGSDRGSCKFDKSINAVFMQTYIKGVSCPYICLDHGMLPIGYEAAGYAPTRFKEKPHRFLKKSREREENGEEEL